MGCCASLLKCCVRAETENPLLDSGHSGGGAGNGQQVRKGRRTHSAATRRFIIVYVWMDERNLGISENQSILLSVSENVRLLSDVDYDVERGKRDIVFW